MHMHKRQHAVTGRKYDESQLESAQRAQTDAETPALESALLQRVLAHPTRALLNLNVLQAVGAAHGNRTVQRMIKRAETHTPRVQRDITDEDKLEPIQDTQNPSKAFKLVLSRNEGKLLENLTKATESVNYRDLENNTDRFGLPQKPQGELYKDFLTDYLVRAMKTAASGTGGGLVFNLKGYNKTNLAIITQKYNEILKLKQQENPKRRYLSHKEFMGAEYTMEEKSKLVKPNEKEWVTYNSPGFTDWEIATILAMPEIKARTTFYRDISDITPSGWNQAYEDYKDLGLDISDLKSMGARNVVEEDKLSPEELESTYGIT